MLRLIILIRSVATSERSNAQPAKIENIGIPFAPRNVLLIGLKLPISSPVGPWKAFVIGEKYPQNTPFGPNIWKVTGSKCNSGCAI